VRRLEQSVDRGLRGMAQGQDRDGARAEWLQRAAFVALPAVQFTTARGSSTGASRSGQLLAAWHARDLTTVRRLLDDLRAERQKGAVHAADLTIDMIHAESAILADLGDTVAALAWLRPTLDSLVLATTQSLTDYVRAGALVRAMALRAELAARTGSPREARSWSICCGATLTTSCARWSSACDP
jgi:hypothetical protein